MRGPDLSRRSFVQLIVGASLVAITPPVLLSGGVIPSAPPSTLPTVGGVVPVPEPAPWERLALVDLPVMLVAGRVYWVVIDDVDSPLGVAHGLAQQFVASGAAMLTGISLTGMPRKASPQLRNARVYADTTTP